MAVAPHLRCVDLNEIVALAGPIIIVAPHLRCVDLNLAPVNRLFAFKVAPHLRCVDLNILVNGKAQVKAGSHLT